MNTYLTKSKLVEFLKGFWHNKDLLTNKKVPELTGKYRPDITNITDGIIVEFDGYRHYNTSKVIYSDKVRDTYFLDNGYRVFRWPYFVQLETRSLKALLDIDHEIEQVCPHGFIDKKAMLPADFCIAGLNRFCNFMDKLSDKTIYFEIMNSLSTNRDNMNIVIPSVDDCLKLVNRIELINGDL